MSGKANDKKEYFRVKMQHDEDTLVKLAHMQYDIFCKGNRISRTIVAAAAVIFGAIKFDNWWGILILAYGCYLLSSTYSSANHTAHKLAKQLKDSNMPFPSSVYSFEDKALHILTVDGKEELDPLPYSAVCRLGEDRDFYYIFRDEYGGYMIPKEVLGTEKSDEFYEFITKKTGQLIANRASPYKRFRAWLKYKENEPYHL